MQNEFDDHIKKQLEDFKLPPSAQVWDLVEAQLPEKRRRRFIFWWLPLGIFLIGFGIYEFVGNERKNAIITDNKITAEINKTPEKDLRNDSIKINNPSRITNNQNKKLDKTTVKFSNKIALNKKIRNNNIVDKSIIIKNNGNKVVLNNGTDSKDYNKLFNKDSRPKNNVSKESTTLDKTNTILESEIKRDGINENKKENVAIKGKLDSQIVNKSIDSSINNLAVREVESTKNDSGLSYPKKAIIKANLAKAKWELIAAIGNANTVGNILSSNGNLQDFSSPNNSATSPGNTGTIAALSTPTSGLSLGIDLQRIKQVTKHLAWFGGVGYHYLSNHQASGALVDSSASVGGRISNNFSQAITAGNDNVLNYYKYGNSINHNNYMHLLNVSIGLKYSICKAFSLKGGLAVGYQINSKWLQPDISQSILFYSDKLTNKWNIGTQVGFDWQFAKSFSIGVFYKYNFSKASLASVQQNLHWQNFGTTVSIKLPLKK